MTFSFKNIAKPGQISSVNPQEEEDIAQSAHKKLLRTMNAVKIVSPIMQALLVEPGIDKSDKAMTENFLEFVKSASELSAKTCLKFNIDPSLEQNFWIRNVFERLYSNLLKEQWIAQKRIDSSEIEQLVDTLINADIKFEKDSYPEQNIDNMSQLQLSLMQAFISVLPSIKLSFDLKRDAKEDVQVIMSKILEGAQKQLVELSDENFDDNQKTSLLKLLIAEGAQLYSASWQSYAKYAQNYYENLSDADKQKFNKKYAKGLPITQLEKDFDDYFDKITIVAKKLLPQNQGTIDKRIKQKV